MAHTVRKFYSFSDPDVKEDGGTDGMMQRKEEMEGPKS